MEKDNSSPLKSAEHQQQLEQQLKIKELEHQLDLMSPGRLASYTSAAGQITEAINQGANVVNSVTALRSAVMNLYAAFEGTKEFAARHRTLELVVVNATRRRLLWEKSFFDSGTTFAGPMPLNVVPVDAKDPVGVTLWTVANGQGAIMTGVSGAGKWRLEGTPFSLILGFTNPQFGSIKSEIGLVGRNAETRLAYDACDNVEAKQYCMFGYTLTVHADEAKAGAERRLVFCIAEDPNTVTHDMGDTLKPGEYLTPGQFLLSRNGRFAASYQSDQGVLMIYDLNGLRRSVWSSGTTRRSAWRCGVNESGQFSVMENERVITWEAPLTVPGGYVKLSDEGSLCLYDNRDKNVWATRN
ncbi:hypothetical protein [Pseudomonas putida]|uniref:hypothetical protein n=1 Tax=Pseudomonas putida TaxID=303 RepID=UPI001F5261E6|nr:hypothetical protein [Pseudomonas putida]MCI0915470.1 hypothetical protein [Pseudomonas putida]